MRIIKMCMRQGEIILLTKKEEHFVVLVGCIVKGLPMASLVIAVICLLLKFR